MFHADCRTLAKPHSKEHHNLVLAFSGLLVATTSWGFIYQRDIARSRPPLRLAGHRCLRSNERAAGAGEVCCWSRPRLLRNTLYARVNAIQDKGHGRM